MPTKKWEIQVVVLCLCLGVGSPCLGKVIYVDTDAAGAGNGTSWADAYNYLQDALADANSTTELGEILVAQGIYRPDEDALHPDGTGDREASFELVNGVAIRGGYAGLGEPDPNARDIVNYETILSGDLSGDDAVVTDPCGLLAEPTRAENSYHVVLWEGVGPPDFDFKENTGLDGFTVTGGNANGEPSWSSPPAGGGIYMDGWGNPTVANCRIVGNTAESGGGVGGRSCVLAGCLITGNAAWDGGAMTSYSSLVKDCIVSGNYAEDRGGGISMWGGDGRFERCTISNNTTDREGGGIFIADAEPVLVDCTFRANSALAGGAVAADHFDNAAYPVFIGCAFIGNKADWGGGMYSYASSSILTNCIFNGNSAEEGGGMANHFDSRAQMVNCTFAGNSATKGRAVSFDSEEPPHQFPSNAELSNCILWDGGDEIFNGDGSEISITYSDVQDGWPGEGNIDADPCFVDPNSGDYHLRSERGRYWPEHDVWVLDKVTSPCIDAGDPYDDPSAEPIPNGDLVNMGAYGGTSYASMSEWALRGDINHDGIVNMIDFSIFADYWLQPSLRAREIDNRLACANNLRALGRALLIYAMDYDDEFPTADQWCDLLLQRESDRVTEEMFVCSSAEGGPSHYAINPNASDSSAHPDMVLLFETTAGWNQFGGPELLAPENHQGEGCNILFVAGHVEFVETERFDELRWE
ncbi:MAG: right-handed parallel beta-helix repeat-containing protein [Sedimentisphaerales bacterium]|nr:right-handed parallel beta-helix repeat-containing protein [Sedimentisphaerales bacterium]